MVCFPANVLMRLCAVERDGEQALERYDEPGGPIV